MEEELANLNNVDEERVLLQFQSHTKVVEEDYSETWFLGGGIQMGYLIENIAKKGATGTKVGTNRMKRIQMKCEFVNGIDVGAYGSREGLLLGCKSDCSIHLRNFFSYHIDMEVHEENDTTSWRFTGFYSSLEEQRRVESWNLLRHLGRDQDLP
ncbi:hypothetical protein J1N35_040198 [Gossypium stocksii]|uniref:Uncharacterized protein n=1 Tax=Gossypium stocksii TaxID=47602 RepID=A0A9D3ZHH3_9ROSI|nr:hypothetical protein J1N35_040198 [Gossypium stocksii]